MREQEPAQPLPVAVLGGGGHAKVVVSTAQAAGYNVVALYDDDPARHGQHVLGVPVVGPIDAAFDQNVPLLIAIGDNATRQRIAARARTPNRWAQAVHPRACVASDVELGAGCVVFAGAVVQPGATLGAHAIVNTGATVDHDCSLGAFVHLAPGVHLAGTVTLGEGAFVGIGSVVLPGLTIGEWAVVGAGAAVTRDVQPHLSVVGVPARTLSRSSVSAC